jgi:hypothetical protein
LFACSLVNIIKLPYFHRYRDSISKLLPDKSDVTVSSIASYFIQFKMFNPSLFTPYLNADLKELPNASHSLRAGADAPALHEDANSNANSNENKDEEDEEEDEDIII